MEDSQISKLIDKYQSLGLQALNNMDLNSSKIIARFVYDLQVLIGEMPPISDDTVVPATTLLIPRDTIPLTEAECRFGEALARELSGERG